MSFVKKYKYRGYRKQEYEDFSIIDGEIWKELENYPEIKVSNIGRILKGDKIAILKKDKNGYVRITIKDKNNKNHHIGVHRLVALAFIPNTDNKPEVDHINTKKDDNRACNLRWVWATENIIDNELTRERFLTKPKYYKKVIYETIRRDSIYSQKNQTKLTYSENTNFWLKKLGIN